LFTSRVFGVVPYGSLLISVNKVSLQFFYRHTKLFMIQPPFIMRRDENYSIH